MLLYVGRLESTWKGLGVEKMSRFFRMPVSWTCRSRLRLPVLMTPFDEASTVRRWVALSVALSVLAAGGESLATPVDPAPICREAGDCRTNDVGLPEPLRG